MLVDGLPHGLLDVLAHLQELQLAREDSGESLQALAHVQLLEQRLLVLRLEIEQRCDEVRDPPRAVLVAGGGRCLVGHVGRNCNDLLELGHHRLLERPGLDVAFLLLLRQRLHPRLEVGLFGQHLEDPHARDALHQDRDPVVRDPHHAQHGGERSYAVEVPGRGLLDRAVLLGDHGDRAVPGHDIVQQRDAAWPPDVEREECEREEHGVPDRQDRDFANRRLGLGLGLRKPADRANRDLLLAVAWRHGCVLGASSRWIRDQRDCLCSTVTSVADGARTGLRWSSSIPLR